MTITLLTGNQPRHTALVELLATIADELFVVRECTTLFPGRTPDVHRASPVMQDYFARVTSAERREFGVPRFAAGSWASLRELPIRLGEASALDAETLGGALDADVFVVFGASYIRGELCRLLMDRRAVNIHMGVSPQYRGSSTNFWALFDRCPQFVGATIHRLSAGLDSGPVLFHALPPAEACDPFDLGMRAVRAAHHALADAISSGELDRLPAIPQDRRSERRYTRSRDFTDEIATEYLSRLATPAEIGAALAQRSLGDYVRPRVADEAARCIPKAS